MNTKNYTLIHVDLKCHSSEDLTEAENGDL